MIAVAETVALSAADVVFLPPLFPDDDDDDEVAGDDEDNVVVTNVVIVAAAVVAAAVAPACFSITLASASALRHANAARSRLTHCGVTSAGSSAADCGRARQRAATACRICAVSVLQIRSVLPSEMVVPVSKK